MAGSLDVNFCTVRVDMDKCNMCLECTQICPTGALTFDTMVVVFMHNAYECSYCNVCMDVCEKGCLKILEM